MEVEIFEVGGDQFFSSLSLLAPRLIRFVVFLFFVFLNRLEENGFPRSVPGAAGVLLVWLPDPLSVPPGQPTPHILMQSLLV